MIEVPDKDLIQRLKTKKIYSLEGNIGAGKTTILKLIAQSFDSVQFVEEPVNQWTNLNGCNLLEKFYSNPGRWGYSFEFYSMLTKLKNLIMAAKTDKPIIVIERSLISNKAFIDASHELGKLDSMEYAMLINTYNFYLENVFPVLTGIIYINTPVDVCVKRIAKRNRDGECEIDKGYLKLLKQKFDDLSKEYKEKCHVIDGLYDLREDVNQISNDLKVFMNPNIKAIKN
jgi:deoxyguanosine kinase